jgi:hypothetical protein
MGLTTALCTSFCQTTASTLSTTSVARPARPKTSPMARTSSVTSPSTGAIWMGLMPAR